MCESGQGVNSYSGVCKPVRKLLGWLSFDRVNANLLPTAGVGGVETLPNGAQSHRRTGWEGTLFAHQPLDMLVY
jgi:hypothetical protein